MIRWKTIGNFRRQWILRKMRTKMLYGNFEKSFLEWENMASRKIFRHFLYANFFMFILLISNHTVFLFQLGINLHLRVFQQGEIALAEAARAISAFWKTHSCKLIPNWTRNRMITYTNLNVSIPRGLSYYLHSKKSKTKIVFFLQREIFTI